MHLQHLWLSRNFCFRKNIFAKFLRTLFSQNYASFSHFLLHSFSRNFGETIVRNANGNFIILSRNISFAGNPSCNDLEMRKSEFMTRTSFHSLKMSYHLFTRAADYWQNFPPELAIFENIMEILAQNLKIMGLSNFQKTKQAKCMVRTKNRRSTNIFYSLLMGLKCHFIFQTKCNLNKSNHIK